MPLVTWLFLAQVAGLWLGMADMPRIAWCLVAASAVVAVRQRNATPTLVALCLAFSIMRGADTRVADARCIRAATVRQAFEAELLEPLRPHAAAAARGTACGARVRVSMGSGAAIPAGSAVLLTGGIRRSAGGLRALNGRVQVLSGPNWMLRLRARVSAQMDRRFGDDAPLARALVLAEQYDLSPELRSDYADAGVIHMVSVSGLHVSIVGGGLLLLLGLCGLSKREAETAALITLGAYVIFIGAPPPAVRSAAMFSLSIVSRWLQRPTSAWAIWAVGSAGITFDPHLIDDLGWQLSVSGMAGLIASGQLSARLFGELSGVRATVVEGVVATGVATLVSAPLVAWTFGRISIVAVLSNLAAAPLFNVAQPLLFLTVLTEWVDPLSAFCGDATRGALGLIGLVARIGARVPFGVIAVAPTALTAGLCAAIGVSTVVAICSRHWRPAAALALGLTSTALFAPALPRSEGLFELHVLDVGQGDALALRTPRGRWILVDAGDAWRTGDAGRSVVSPHLRRYGGDVVALVMTHPHEDHIGGIRSLLRLAAVDTLFDSGYRGSSGSYREVLDSAIAAHTAYRLVGSGDSLEVDGVSLNVLAPAPGWLASQTDPNEASVVLLVQYGRARLLLTGDAEAGEEQWLIEQYAGALHADVLKVAHHGSATSSTSGFLSLVKPQIALVSVGVDNEYGHPSNDVLRRLDAVGARVLRTDDEGTIVLKSDGQSIHVKTANGEWHFLARSSGS